MFDLIVVGDSVIDTIIPIGTENLLSGDKSLAQAFCLPLGQKIPVGESVSMVAGNAANVSVGSARLGLKTAIFTYVGNKDDDADDDRIVNKLKNEKVDTRYVITDDNLPSNHNIILAFKSERTILVHHQPWKFKLPELDRAKWVYLTSLSPSYTDSHIVSELIQYLERTGARLIYQPGTFQIKEGHKKQTRLLSLCEVFVSNAEEAKLYLNLDVSDTKPIKKLLNEIHDLGVKNVVITDGGEGAYGFNGEEYFHLPVFPAKLVEMTGAGDAFATGLMSGLIHGKDLSEAMRWGGVNSASVVEEIGAMKGLLSFNTMQKKLKDYKDIVAKEI